ncbi:hypothetical protein ABT160_10205 [Streptomyces sp. NPDC001941]|uniref:hypothetical protein n=1 Tax=Streptomyces sp. NPDC001941 TaxID=3154659 RepID=UPI00332FCB41
MTTAPEGYKYSVEAIQGGVDRLAKGTEEIKNSVTVIHQNAELNFENWAGNSKEEFNRVLGETTAHLVAIGGWLEKQRDGVLRLIQQVEEKDKEHANKLANM